MSISYKVVEIKVSSLNLTSSGTPTTTTYEQRFEDALQTSLSGNYSIVKMIQKHSSHDSDKFTIVAQSGTYFS